MERPRWHRKADALYSAWVSVVHTFPSMAAVELCLAVAQHETGCGDYWPGEHNWGAVQKRKLTTAERSLLSEAGIEFPKRDNAQLARASEILHQAAAAGRIDPIRDEALHFDSSPTTGLYVVWFHAFPNDLEGAKKFVEVLVKQRVACREILERPLPTPSALAAAMYETKYYEGFHDPSTPAGRNANINDYTQALRAHQRTIQEALTSWVTPQVELPSGMAASITTVRGQCQALNYMGYARPLLDEATTTATSRKFIASVGFFQGANTDAFGQDLVIDGDCGARTQAALLNALAGFQELKDK